MLTAGRLRSFALSSLIHLLLYGCDVTHWLLGSSCTLFHCSLACCAHTSIVHMGVLDDSYLHQPAHLGLYWMFYSTVTL